MGVEVTCVAIVRVPGKGAVLASDGRICQDQTIITDNAVKLVSCGPSLHFALCGEVGATWRLLTETPPKTFKAFLRKMAESKESLDYLGFDLVNEHIWSGDVKVSRLFSTLGSGSDIALGALEVLPQARTLEDAERVAKKAIEAACRYSISCGGRIRTLIVTKGSKPSTVD